MKRTRIGLLGAIAFALVVPLSAHAALSVTPLTWNVVGLDSNDPAAGPKYFPVGARVCSTTAAAGVTASFVWDSANPYVSLRTGTPATIALGALAAGACADAYFEVELAQVAAAFDTKRRYRITATDGANAGSTPSPRELYVEHLISQNRNAVTDVKLDGVSIAPGGSMNLVVGNTYAIELDGGTATQGYNQFEAFVNFPNTIFQILSVSTTYSADNSPWVPGPAPIASDKFYADACLWQNDPASPNYRSCVGGDYKAGGSDVRTTYTVRIVGGGGTQQTLSTLLYDFSGSSYHYNADFSAGARIANIIDPTAAGIAKKFSPASTTVNGVSTLTITLSNPNPGALSGYNFNDPLPPNMKVANPPAATTAGCGAPTLTAAAGASSISFANGTVAGNGTCAISVNVTASAAATYTNTTDHLFLGATDTGKTATANLTVSNAPPPPACTPGLELARWNMDGTTAGTIATAPGYFSKNPQVGSATASFGAAVGATQSIVANGNPANSWGGTGWVQSGSPTATTASFFEFTLDTSRFSGVSIQFDGNPIGNGDWGNPNNNNVHVWSSADGGAFTLLSGFPQNMTKNAWTANLSGAATTTGTGTTTFRININGTNKAAGVFAVDNIVFRGCGIPDPPTIAKTFLSNPVGVGAPSTLRFTLTNPNPVALTGVKFIDNLPVATQVAATPAASTTCGGTPTWAPGAGATVLAFGQTTGATVPASGSCTVSVDVVATTAGPRTNVSDYLSSTETGVNSGPGGSAVATLTALAPPTIAKAFTPDPIPAGGRSLLTFTIANPNPSDALTGVAFADTYPAGLVNVTPLLPPVANTCGGSVTAVAGGGSISLSGGTVAAGSYCTVSVTVTAAAAGAYPNTSGAVSASVAGTGNTASATLTVDPPNPAVSLLKQVGPASTGPWSKLLTVAPGAPVHYKFTVENTGDVTLTTFNVGDPVLAGTAADPAVCAWQTPNVPSTLPTLPVGTPTIDPTATCVVGPVIAAAGDHVNTATAHAVYNGITYDSAPNSAEYLGAAPGFTLLKQIGTSASGPWSAAVTVAAGSNVHYRFTIVNTGALAITGVGVTDPLVSTASCLFSDPLPAGASTTCVVGPVTASGAPGSTTTNTAFAQGTSGGGPVTTSPSSASYTILGSSADLSITKTDGVATVVPGSSVTYTIVASNAGPSAVTGATVSDTLPATLSGATWTCVGAGGGTCTASGSGNIADTVNLPAGASVTYTLTATLSAAATGTLLNTATIAAPGGVTDPTPGNNSATDTDTITATADLSITKTDGVATVVPGTSVTYTIVASNAGPSAVTGATVSDTLPASLSGATWTCVGAGGGTCTASGSGNIADTVNLPVGASVTYTLTATLSAAATGTLLNTATIAAPGGVTDPTPGNNSATDTDTIVPTADLSITKTDGVATVVPGSSVTYTIVASNAGPSAVTGATVSDTLPATLSGATWTCVGAGGGTCTASGSGNIADTVNLPAGASVTYTLTATLSAAATGTLVNTATTAAPGGVTDPTPGNNSATDTDTIVPQVSLAVVKTDGSATYTPGGTATYTVTVTNAGPSAAANVTVSDALPAGVTLSANASCAAAGAATCGTVTGTIGQTSFGTTGASIPAGGGNSLAFTVPVAFAAGMTTDPLVNTATATDVSSGATASGSDSDARSLDVTLAVTKTDGSATYVPGGTATYTVTVANTGASDASAVTVSDALPAGVTLTGAVACVANGTSSCGTVSGIAGQTAFGATGARVGAGAANTLVFTVPVSFAPGMTTDPLVNTATATDAASGASASGSDSDARATAVSLAVVKTDGSASYAPGGTATYTVTVVNGGTSDALGVTLADSLPAGVSLTGNVTCVAAGAATCGIVTGTAGQTSFGTTGATIPAGVGNSLAFTAPVAFAPGLATDPLVNTATATDVPSGATGSGSDSDARAPQVTLTVTKTDGSATYTPGGTATYTIVVGNTGASNALAVSVTDNLPTGVALAANVSCVAAGAASCGTVTGTTGQTSFGTTGAAIAAGAGNTLTFTVPVAFASGLVDDPLVNAVSVTDVASGASGSATDSDARAAVAALAVTKTDGSATYTPGGTATYTVTVTNAGPSDALNVTVADPLPAGVTLTANAACVAAGTANCGTVTGAAGATSFGASGARIAAGVGNSLTFTVPVAFAAGMTANPLVNTATATDPAAPGPASGSDSDALAAAVTLAVTKTDGSATYVPGGTATYTITVANNGASVATNVTVSDALPAGVTLSANATCIAAGIASCGTVSGAAGATSFGATGATIGAGAGNLLTFTAPVAFAPGMTTDPLVNAVNVSDVSGATGSATDSDARAAAVSLAVTKTDGSATYTPGGTATYTVTVVNTGASDATNVTVTDALPAGVTLSANATCVAGGGSSCGAVTGSAGQASFGTTGARIVPGAGNALTFTVPVAFAVGMTTSPLVNIATATDVASGATASGSDSDVLAAATSADLTIVKSGPAQVTAGGPIVWLLTIGNLGPASANGATFSDPLPTGVTNVAASCGSAAGGAACGTVSYALGVVTGTVAALPVGGSVVITIQAQAPANAGITLPNTATVSPPPGISDPGGGNNSSSATTIVQGGGAATPVPVDARWALAMLTLLLGAAAARRLGRAERQ